VKTDKQLVGLIEKAGAALTEIRDYLLSKDDGLARAATPKKIVARKRSAQKARKRD